MQFNDTGSVRFEHRTADGHSDLTLALAIANWHAAHEYFEAMVGHYAI